MAPLMSLQGDVESSLFDGLRAVNLTRPGISWQFVSKLDINLNILGVNLIPEMSSCSRSHLTEWVLLDGAWSPPDQIRQNHQTAPEGIS